MARERDFCKLDASTQTEVRRITVNMVKTGHIRIKAEKAEGASALLSRKRGRLPGEQSALSAGEEAMIRKQIVELCPDQLKLAFALWTREAVRKLIERKTGK